MAASGLMLAMGCSGRDSDGVLQPAEPAQNSEQYAGMLPELPQDAPLPRSGQVASLIGLDGDEAVAEYLGQPDSTTHLMVLPSLAQRAGWAMYRFDGLALSDAPASLTVELQTPLPTGLYLGVADYGSGRWEITPVGSPQLSQTFGVPQSGDVISPAGSLYCVLFTYGGQMARIRRLTLAVDAPAPPPLGLAASENHSDRVRLTWTDQALSYDPDGAGPGQFEYVGTEIHRSFSTAGPWVKIAQVPNGTTSYDDADGEHNPLPYDEPVYYRLHTRLIGLTGPASGADEGRRVILPPTSLEASDGLYWDRIELRWPAVEGAQLYRLYYKLTGDPGDDFDELLETEETSFMHSFLDPAGMGCTYDTVYSYAVAVIVDGEEGQWLTDEGHCVVQAPVNFNATDGTEDGKVILTWDAADGAVAYDIEFRKAEETDADFRTIFLTGPPYEYTSETTFEHTLTEPEANPLEPNTTYVYRVRSRAWLSQWLYSYDWSTPDEGHARETLEARFTATPPDGPAPLTVQFDATQSIAPQGGSITLYEWDFEGDGVVDFSGASADTISHQYLQQGLLNPTLTVHGTSGGTHSASFRLPVGGWIHTAGLDLAEQASCVSVDPAGGIYAAGHGQTMGGPPDSDLYLARYSAAGELEWARLVEEAHGSAVHGVLALSDGAVLLLGLSNMNTGVVRIDSDGATQWGREWRIDAGPWHITQPSIDGTETGNLYLAATAWPNGGGEFTRYAVAARIDPSGTLVWHKSYINSTAGYSAMHDIAIGTDGPALLLHNEDTNTLEFVRIGADGAIVQQAAYGAGSVDGWGYDILPAPAGRFILIGTEGLVVSLNSALALQWEMMVSGLTEDWHYITAAAVDGNTLRMVLTTSDRSLLASIGLNGVPGTAIELDAYVPAMDCRGGHTCLGGSAVDYTVDVSPGTLQPEPAGGSMSTSTITAAAADAQLVNLSFAADPVALVEDTGGGHTDMLVANLILQQ